jgi:hypothetical protein
VDSEIVDGLELALLDGHGLGGEAFAHALGLDPAVVGVDPAGAVVAALPADGDGGVVTGWGGRYKVKVSMQAA